MEQNETAGDLFISKSVRDYEEIRFRLHRTGTIPLHPCGPFVFVFTDKLSSDPKIRPAACSVEQNLCN